MDNDTNEGWSFGHRTDAEWVQWGSGDLARARVVAMADDYHLIEIEARAGYRGDRHEHHHAELSYVLNGTVRSNGVELGPGDGCAAGAGTVHRDFEALTDASYLSIVRL